MQRYIPNLSDPRVVQKINKVLRWSAPLIQRDEIELNSSLIREVFGNTSQELPALLFRILFQRDPTSSYHTGHINGRPTGQRARAFNYHPQPEGFRLLKQALQDRRWPDRGSFRSFKSAIQHLAAITEAVNGTLTDTYADELKTGEFQLRHEDGETRVYHPLQQLPRTVRNQFWLDHGYGWDYDISTAMPTLLLQHAKRHGLDLPTLADYAADKRAWRALVRQACQCTDRQAKRTLTAIINGARFNRFSALTDILGLDGMHAVCKQQRLKQLAAEAAQARKLLPTTDFYFREERRILDVAREFLGRHGVKAFPMHDGCITSGMVEGLEAEIAARTGWDVGIEWSELKAAEPEVSPFVIIGRRFDLWIKNAYEAIMGEPFDLEEAA